MLLGGVRLQCTVLSGLRRRLRLHGWDIDPRRKSTLSPTALVPGLGHASGGVSTAKSECERARHRGGRENEHERSIHDLGRYLQLAKRHERTESDNAGTNGRRQHADTHAAIFTLSFNAAHEPVAYPVAQEERDREDKGRGDHVWDVCEEPREASCNEREIPEAGRLHDRCDHDEEEHDAAEETRGSPFTSQLAQPKACNEAIESEPMRECSGRFGEDDGDDVADEQDYESSYQTRQERNKLLECES
jgi:hypothetical protein